MNETAGPKSNGGQDWHLEATTFDRMAEERRRTRLPLAEHLAIYRDMGLLDWLDTRPPDEPVLEIGACDGLHLLNLAEARDRPGVAIDVSLAMLGSGLAEARARHLDVGFVASDALHLAVGDRTVRTVLLFNVLHHFFFHGLERILSEAGRVLKPGGRVFIGELSLLYPYHVLAFGGAQVIKRIARLDVIDRTFTDNEMALWPGRIADRARRVGLRPVAGSVGFYPYVTRLPPAEGETSPWLFRAAWAVCRAVGRLGPRAWRHDSFHMALERPENAP
ncbi:MAG: class I SAM-dependent methyltransferase [Phycisphaerae bacterium]